MKRYYLLFIALNAVAFFSVSAQTPVPDSDEITALTELYTTLHADTWNVPSNKWTLQAINNYPNTPLWGITITNGDVTAINVIDVHQTAPMTLPATSLNLLKALTEIKIYDNWVFYALGGSFPDLHNLTSLKTLDLRDNDFLGQLPSSIGGLTNLEYLNLTSAQNLSNSSPYTVNIISGPLPVEMGSLVKLKEFYFDYNNLSGANPIPSSFGGLSALIKLSLKACNILSTSANNALGTLMNASLNYLDVSYNNIQIVPSNFGNLTSLQTLYLSVNPNLDFNSLSNLSSNLTLTQLYVNNCNLTGLAGSLNQLVNLQILDASRNNLGTIPQCIKQMPSLQELYLYSNNIAGALPLDFGTNSQATLSKLSLARNQITDVSTAAFFNFRQLTQLDLSQNQIAGSLPSNFNLFTKLTYLNLEVNQITNSLPDLSGLTTLNELHLNDNNFTGSLPQGLSQVLTKLYIQNNNFSGAFPAYLFGTNYSNPIQYIDISNNAFTSWPDLPDYIWQYSYAYVDQNYLDFGDIEPSFFYYQSQYYSAVVSVYQNFRYAQQKLTTVGTAQTVEVVEATTLTLQNLVMSPAVHNLYEWQKFDGTNWNTVQAASANNYVVPNVTAAVGGIYQMKITNSWVPNLTYYSAPITVVVLPPLCDSYIPAMAGSFKMDKVTGAIVFDRNDCTQDIPLTCLYGPAQNVNNVVSASASLFTDNWDDGIATNNPFQTGEREWRQKSAFSFNTKINYQSNSANLSAGVFSYKPFNWTGVDGSQPAWLKATDIEKYSADGEPVQERNALKIPSATRFGYDGSVPYLIVQNAEYDNVVFESFEKTYGTGSNLSLEDNITLNGITLSSTAHSGVSSLPLTGSFSFRTLTTKGKDVTVRFWLTGDVSAGNVAVAATSGVTSTPTKIATSGLWSLWESTITGPGSSVTVSLTKGNGGSVYVDDVRLQPVDAEMTCYVYDPRTLRLLAVFDDRHFGMYYQYSEEGKLVRKMIETEKGIKTIQETQYNLPTQTK